MRVGDGLFSVNHVTRARRGPLVNLEEPYDRLGLLSSEQEQARLDPRVRPEGAGRERYHPINTVVGQQLLSDPTICPPSEERALGERDDCTPPPTKRCHYMLEEQRL